ncbi:hypothetical protein PENPOL_c003G08804 [Penicillium polonicum]|uniref:Uncharacterized protein n=1 Tax=Penicillium polonicum TaxID=60169 RepID=A0A1V6NSA3_PENPO|nr:hypothetical protein PENPOL_c003G08804 [Penicillium polonicum]
MTTRISQMLDDFPAFDAYLRHIKEGKKEVRRSNTRWLSAGDAGIEKCCNGPQSVSNHLPLSFNDLLACRISLPRPSTERTIARGSVNAASNAPSTGVATSVVSADSEIAFLNCHHRSSSPLPCGRREPIFITSRTGPGQSLHYIQSQHNTTYDSDGWQPPMFFTYIYPANNIWVSQANHTLFMFEVIAEAQQKGCPVILVVSGWAGLTKSPVMLDHILRWFDGAGVVVHIRVFAEVSRHFFDINV